MRKILLLLILAFAAPLLAQQRYYVWDGSSLQPLYNLQGITCDHWAIWVFGDGVDAIPGKQWGEIDGKTANEAERKWEAALKFENKWKKFANISSDSTGCENHLGPIAIIKPASQSGNSLFVDASGKTKDLFDRIIKDYGFGIQLIEAYNKYVKNAAYVGLYTDPKSELLEYLKNLHDVMEKVNKLRHNLNDINRFSLMFIKGQLDDINQSLAMTEGQGQTLAKTLHMKTMGNSAGSWLGKKVYFSDYSGQLFGAKIEIEGSKLLLVGGRPHGENMGSITTIRLSTIYNLQYSHNSVFFYFKDEQNNPESCSVGFLDNNDASKFYQYLKTHGGQGV